MWVGWSSGGREGECNGCIKSVGGGGDNKSQ